MIQFTANVKSLADLDRRIAKVAAAAERQIGGEIWQVPNLIALPGPIPLDYYAVQLCAAPDSQLRQTTPPVPPEWAVVETMSEAREAVQNFLRLHCKLIGPGNWTRDSGRVWDHQGEVIARFSFDLRCWFSTYGGSEIRAKL